MGSPILELFESKEIKPEELTGKILAVDAFNTLYTFLTTIRGADGSPLTDSKGRITSHLVGVFSRFSNLQEKGIKFIFVFDGEAPELKKQERERRKSLKIEAQQLYEEAKQAEDIENMKKYAARTAFLTQEMVQESKKLVNAMGMCVVEAPSEGEAQAAQLVKAGEAYAVLSQDADSLLCGGTKVIRNLSISGKRKVPGTHVYKPINPEIITLKENLEKLNLTQDQLIILAILVGTDYNYGGIKGIGPKKALKLLEKHKDKGDNYDAIFEEAKWSENFPFPWQRVYETIKHVPVKNDCKIIFNSPDIKEIKKILIDEHDFSEERVNSTLEKIESAKKNNAQKGLGEFF